ncbi:AIPR family protein [Mycetocola spongiae]|uniref:AIPR family protein n=1 Tax=Mycetocola spongiae TaxID=2859226 RepID=UPI001CF4A393|nr:AIPR family protein [Mycetocola spongiae]UCR89160.1 AIPR family protein [Mycetocola spongiae]
MPKPEQQASESWKAAFRQFSDHLELSADGIGLFAIDQRFGIEDVRTAAADSITGGGDDKKLDVIYLDTDRGLLVVAQCLDTPVVRVAAPANKASDLNTALAWLLSSEIDDVPEELRGRVSEVRDAIQSDRIRDFHVWYVHNVPESANAQKEVNNAAKTAAKLLENRGGVQIFGAEIGTETLERWYLGSKRTIKVTEKLKLRVSDAIETSSDRWDSVTTLVPGTWLRSLFSMHKEDLFSANVRDYLGSRRSIDNINNGIKITAIDEPADFAVYNNGLTALVLDYDLGPRTRSGRSLEITGISVVNGAQTTGSIGSLEDEPSADLLVPVRFVKSGDEALLESIVRFNNLQNKVQAADFRSGDEIQNRLRSEFEGMSGVSYDGGRRGGGSDVIKRSRATLPSHTVGQVLTAFHGDPVAAYDKKAEIWIDDAMYSRVFSERTTAAHVLFAYSLYDALTTRLLTLRAKSAKAETELSSAEEKELTFLSLKGAPYLLIEAVARSLETMLGKTLPSRFALSFRGTPTLADAAAYWNIVIEAVLPLSDQLRGAFSRGRVSKDGKDDALSAFEGLFGALQSLKPDGFTEFSKVVVTTARSR